MRIQASSTPLTLYDSRYVNVTGDTMTGALVVGTSSGATTPFSVNVPSTATAGFDLTVATHNPFAMRIFNTTYSASSQFAYFPRNTGEMDMGTDQATPLRFYTNGFANIRMTLSSGGLVGIGQAPVTHKLEVNGSVSVASGNAFRAGSNWLIGNSGSDVQIGSASVANNFNWLSTTSVNIMSLSTTGSLGIGLSAANIASGAKLHVSDTNTVNANLISTDYQVISAQSGAPGLSIISSTATAGNRGVFKGVRSRGTLASPTVPSTDDDVLSFLGAIYDSATTQGSAMIAFMVDGAVSSGVAPQRIDFYTSATTGAARTAKLSIKSSGKIQVTGTTSYLDMPNADTAAATDGWLTSAGRNMLGISSGNKTMLNASSSAGGEFLFITGGAIANTLGGMTNGGKFYIGTTSAPASGATLSVTATATTVAHFFNTAASGASAGAGMIGYSDDGAALASGDRLGFFLLGGSTDGSHTLFNGAGIQAFTTEGWSGTLGGTELRLEVTPNGSHTRVVPLTLGQDSTATLTGNLTLSTVGKGILIKEGSNATMGTATLSAGTVVVSTTKVTANSRIFLQVESLGTVILPKSVGVTARTAATSFTITSSDVTDTSVVAWLILEPS